MHEFVALAIYNDTCISITPSVNYEETVLVGDNITIQEQPKKVRFALTSQEQEPALTLVHKPVPESISIVENPLIDISSVVLVIPSKEPPLSLYAVEEPIAADEVYTSVSAPLSMQEQLDAMPWKHKFAIKACYAALFSTPFILVAAIQPWNG